MALSHRKARAEFLKKWKAKGQKTTFYTCLHCLNGIETIRPGKDDVPERGYWDTLAACPTCRALNFIKVYPTGKVNVQSLDNACSDR